MGDNLEKTEIQWHPGFYGAAELELLYKLNAIYNIIICKIFSLQPFNKV